MAIVKCKECGAEISTKAAACPKCGAAQKAQTSGCAWVVIIVFFGAFAVLYQIGKSAIDSVADKTPAPAHVSSAPAEREYELELLGFKCSDNGIGTAVVDGRVKNISSKTIDTVWAVAEFYDKGGSMISSDSGVAEIHPLLPGQTTPFKVLGPRNPAVSSCSIAGFRHTFSGQISWRKADKK